jgi:hypothetical protein
MTSMHKPIGSGARRSGAALACTLGALLALAAGCGGGGGGSSGGGSSGGTGTAPFTTFQAASVALGQPNLTTGTSYLAGADTVGNPFGNPGWDGTHLLVPVRNEARVLIYSGIPTLDGTSAVNVVGQSGLTGSSSGSGAANLKVPTGAFVNAGELWIADHDNHRVTHYSSVPSSDGASADFALGGSASAGVAGTGNCDSTGLWPSSVFIVGTKLLVTDDFHNRVMIWNALPADGTTAADLVLGQTLFTQCAINDVNNDGGGETVPDAHTMQGPSGVWSDGTRVVVADANNRRVLIWNTFPVTNGQPADLVLGETSMTGYLGGTSQSLMNAATSIASDGTSLIVTDSGNKRVMIWNTFPTTTGQAADEVLGQSNFTNATANDENQDGSPDSTPGPHTFGNPNGLLWVGTKLIVGDTPDNRYVIFAGP